MQEEIKKIQQEATAEIQNAGGIEQLEAVRVKYLGRKGIVADLMSQLPGLPADQKPVAGKLLNQLKTSLSQEINTALKAMKQGGGPAEAIDITMPGIKPQAGYKHPLTQVVEQICSIFAKMGFNIVEGPEIETDYYNFQALNIPQNHPSRDAFDTFFLNLPSGKTAKDKDWLLRSQTSTVQIRVMEKTKPPLKILAPGKVFRPDAVDASHSFMFHQVEGFAVDKNITFAQLKGALFTFAKEMFGPDIKMRFRPHFFPFTEPSVEVDISCIICKSKKQRCSVCGGKGWLEILGAGMIDPAVFEAVGYDPKKYTGFAFGMGIERIAMLKYGISDIRMFFDNDLRFLRQF